MAKYSPFGFVALLLVVHSCATLDVQYLQRNFRNTSTIEDYYFSCSAVGQTLQWSVNKLGLGGFFTGSNAGDLLTSSRPNFTYSSSLLSKELSGQFQVKFTSVLVVSVLHSLHLEVACRTEAEQEIINNSGSTNNFIIRENVFGSVYLQYALNKDIVGLNESTSLFLCEADGLSMTWHASANYPFVSDDVIGANWLEVFSGGERHKKVKEQAILIAHQPRPFVSLLIVTNYTGITIICGSNQDSVQISPSSVTDSNNNVGLLGSHSASESPNATESPTSKISTLASSIVSSTMFLGYGQRVDTTVLLVVYTLVLVALIAIIVALLCVILKCWRSSRQKYNMEEENIRGQPKKPQCEYNMEEKNSSEQPETTRHKYNMQEQRLSRQPETTQYKFNTEEKIITEQQKITQLKRKGSTENCDKPENDNDFSQSEGFDPSPRESTPNHKGCVSRSAWQPDGDPDVSFVLPRQRAHTIGTSSSFYLNNMQHNASVKQVKDGEGDKDSDHFDSNDNIEDSLLEESPLEESQLLNPTKKSGQNLSSVLQNFTSFGRNRSATEGSSGRRSRGNSSAYKNIKESPQ